MYRKTAGDLGLDTVLHTVSQHALSKGGEKRVLSARPVFDREAWAFRQNQVAEVISCIIQAPEKDIRIEAFPDLTELFYSLESGPASPIDGTMIYDAAVFIDSARIFRKFLRCLESPTSVVSDIIDEIDFDLLDMTKQIFSILQAPGTVKETYPTIRRLKEAADLKRDERSHFAAEYVRNNNSFMTGTNPVLRDGRIVLPVKNDLHGKIEGYIQGASQTGQTVFMEPFRLVNLNNEVNLAQQEIEIEIARLIGMLSGLLRKNEEKLRILEAQVTESDFLYAFASWSRSYNCCRVITGDEYSCNLIKARHPLLKSKCVPVDFCVPKTCRAVVLTGPNAGGKTVTIKTVGLFAMINQICGYIPASDGSSLDLFDRFFTDIGDDQSIENQLSTFSGHMKGISFILRTMTENSLVILDELGSGTDPQEGAALARAILEYCMKKASLTLVTSHHGVLKQFAYASENVLNASMEFDENTLEPTFRVISGLPGESHAIDTARRMHLPKSVTHAAQSYLGKEAVRISSIIRNLESRRREAEKQEQEIRQKLKETDELLNSLKQKELHLKAEENKLEKRYSKEFDSYVRKNRRELENLVRELREGEITREKNLKVKAFIDRQEEELQSREEKALEHENEIDRINMEELVTDASNVELKSGMTVYCGPNRREGTVVRKEKNGKWQVAIGPIRFTFKESELVVPAVEKKITAAVYYSAPQPKLSLDLRGYRLEEALDAVDREIESCCVHGIRNFSIIHGYGDGILSTGIHTHLRLNPLIEACEFAHPDDGGQGKTYVTLKIR
ncbi:MAG: Smr/MutS family protein [Sphaerochaetaceae bacterium]|nr:Smr/MutS family protein [Sphaerochaetaceae bacterium]